MNFYQTVSCRTSRDERLSRLQAMMLWLLGGVCVGTLCAAKLPPHLLDPLERFFGGAAVTAAKRSLWDVFCGVSVPSLLCLAGMLIAGCSAIGQPLAAVILILRGMAIGAAGTRCFETYGLQNGLPIAAVMLLPVCFLTGVLLAFAAKDALTLSALSLRYLFLGQADAEISTLRKNIHLRWLAYSALTLAAAALHTALMWGFTQRLLLGNPIT